MHNPQEAEEGEAPLRGGSVVVKLTVQKDQSRNRMRYLHITSMCSNMIVE